MVSYNTFRIGYAFGGNTGYSRENAYMEAARCLRYFLAREIQILDKSMGIEVTIDDICDFVDLDIDDDETTTTDNTNTIHQQPIINIINSNVTIGNNNNNNTYHSNNVISDHDDDYNFIFEEPYGEFGTPSAGDNDDDIDGLDFGDIIEI